MRLEEVEIPRSDWPADAGESVQRVWRVGGFFVMYAEDGGRRLAIHRTEMHADGDWDGGITWDELQALKSAVGFGREQAIELYPPDRELINLYNIRHLWLMKPPLQVGWK